MTDEMNPAPEAGEEVVQSEAIEAEAPEAAESTEGQEQTQPADDKSDEVSKSKERRERRKAELDKLRTAEADAQRRAQEAETRRRAVEDAAKNLPKPKQADFADFEEYQAALSAYHSVGVMDRREMQRLEAEAKAHYAEVKAVQKAQEQADAQSWATQMQEARTRYSDFDKVALRDAPIDQRMAKHIVQSDVAADVAYFLGKNPDVAREIAAFPDVQMARAIGRIEAQVSAPKPKTVSTAPDPISPVSSKASPASNPEKMSYAEYVAARKAGKLK